MSRFLIACGGTGGHLAPGLALAQWLTSRGHQPLLLISDKQIDARLIQKYPDIEFQVTPGAPLVMGAKGLVKFALQQTRGLFFSWRLILREQPVLIVGFGGFTTAALIVAGWLRGVPVALHESNRVVGRAVRMLARFADRVYVPRGIGFEGANQSKLRHVGLPVREEVARIPRGEAAEAFGLDPNKKTLVVMGGSQGAQALTRWANDHVEFWAQRNVQQLIVAGPLAGEASTEEKESPDGTQVKTVTIPFCDHMGALYSVGDLVVSRSGAGTLAELVRCQTPAVLVPYPFAADQHQAANAIEFVRRSGSVTVPETELDGLTNKVDLLISADARLVAIQAQLREMQRAEALDLMFTDLEVLAGLREAESSIAPWGVARS
ncbi:UDP-N-acetylglucosamine--N-acetylmuramyl-(pentapeptide) pyrophosphoryl-undecaprenol N-acetylglucosamine transferase [Opitutaceae bacterium]|nr:UDP-N-acetylglucosamine--N-acetylmuramyl-(pentapeptide) pyrophosphoryl-undecaprenol N-acetylglucosamine transferase [Opitutaceae bacterium]